MQDQATVAIASDDPPQVWLELLDGQAAESEQDPSTIRVWRNGPLLYELTVLYTYAGTAVADDVASLPSYITIPAGESSALITLTPVDDDLPEWPETLIITLADAAAYNPAEPPSATITIADNDPPWVYITAADPTATENDPQDTGRLLFTRIGPDDVDLVVHFAVTGGTADGADHEALPASVTIPTGQAAAELVLTPADDELAEVPETLIISLVEDPAYRLYDPALATLTIVDDENQPPTAADDFFGGVTGFVLYLPAPGILYNDQDPDGHSLIALLEDLPQHGTLELHEDGSFAYTPDAGYIGDDLFTYRASDTGLASELATVYLRIYPHAPNLQVRFGQQDVAHSITTLDLGHAPVGYPQDYTFELRNDGTDDLTLDIESWTLPAGYLLHTPPDGTVEPGGSTSFVLRLAAQEVGTYSGTVSLASNDPDENPFEFGISAEVWPAAPEVALTSGGETLTPGTGTVDFGTAHLNFPVTRTFQLHNVGTAILEIDPQQIELPAGFSLVVAPPATLEIDQQAEFVVQFDASAVGTTSGTFSLPSNARLNNPFTLTFTAQTVTAPEIQVAIDGELLAHGSGTLDFGVVPVGTTPQRTLTISNIGSESLVLTYSPILPPSIVADWTEGDLVIEPGQSHEVTLSFPALVPGSLSGQAALFNNDSDEQPFTFQVAASVAAPTISVWDGQAPVAPSALVDLGHTPLAMPLEHTFTIINQGEAALLLDSPILPTGWELAAAPAAELAPSGSTSFTIRLPAAAAGRYSGHIVLPSNDPWAGLFTFGVTAAVALPELQVSVGEQRLADGGRLAFGNTPIGTPVDRVITITNAGSADLTLGPDILLPDGYTLQAPPDQYTLAPGQSTQFTVRLTAQAAGRYAGTLQLATNDQRHLDFQLELIGKAALPEVRLLVGEDLIEPGSQMELGLTLAGTPRSQIFTILNAGTADLELGELVLPEGIALLGAPQAAVAPGQATSIELELTAAAAGRFVGTVRLPTNDPDHLELRWDLACSVAEISQIRLWNDTGVSNTDLAASDPSLAISVVGMAEDQSGLAEAIEVQLDLNQDEQPDVAYLARAGVPLVVTPPGIQPGTVNVAARLRIAAQDPADDLLGPWVSFSFTLETGTNAAPVVSELALANDTGGSATDGHTSDPTITGLAANDGNVAYLAIELDLDDDGQPDMAELTDEQGRFSIKPIGLEPGEITVKLRAVEPDYPEGRIEGPWVAFAFTLVEPAPPQIATLALARDTGESNTDLATYDPTLTGSVAAEGNPRLLLVELDTNDDGASDLTAPVDEQGLFTLKPRVGAGGLQPGSVTVHVRAIAPDLGLSGEWVPFSFTLYEKPGPTITGLALLRDTGPSDTDAITSDPTLTGQVAGAADVAYATVQFDYTGDGEPDESTVADEQGRFEHLPGELQYGEHTVRVRASVFDTELGRELAGEWASITFTYEQPAGLVVEWLALLNDTGASDTDGITSDPTVHGQLGGEAVIALQQVEIDLNADGRPDDTTTSDETGRFLYNARNLPGGSVTVAARGVHWDPQHQAYVYGQWASLAFSYEPASELGGPQNPGLDEGTAQASQTAAAALLAVRSAIGAALASHATATGLAAEPGTINLGLVNYHTLTDAAIGRAPQRGQYGFQDGSLPVGGDWQSFFSFNTAGPLTALDVQHEAEIDLSEGDSTQGSQTTGSLLSSLAIAISGGSNGTFTIDLAVSLDFSRSEHGSREVSTHGGQAAQGFLTGAAGSYSLTISIEGTYEPGQEDEVLYAGTITVTESLTFDLNFDAQTPYSGTVGSRTADGQATNAAGGSASYVRQITTGSFSTSTAGANSAQIDYATQQTFTQSYTINDAGNYYPAGSGSSGSYVHARSYSVTISSTDAGTLSLNNGVPSATVGAFTRDESTVYTYTETESRTHALNHLGGSVVHSFASTTSGSMSFRRQESGTYYVSPGSYLADVIFAVNESGSNSSSGDTVAAYAYVYQGVNVADSTQMQTSGSMGFSYAEQGTYTLSNGTYLVNGTLFDSHASFVHSETVQQNSSRQGPNFQASFSSTRTSDTSLTQTSAGMSFSIGPEGTSASGTTSMDYTATGAYTLSSSATGSNPTSSYASSLSQAGNYSSQFDSSGSFARSAGGGTSATANYSSSNDFAYTYAVDLAGTRTSTISTSSFTRHESGSSSGSYTDAGTYESDGTSASVSGSYQLALDAQSNSSLQSSGTFSWTAGVGAESGAFNLSITTTGTRSEAQSGDYSDDGTDGSFTSSMSTNTSQQLTMSGSHTSPYIGSNYTFQQDSQFAANSTHTGTFYRGPAGSTTSGNINRTSSGTTNSIGQGAGYYSFSFPTGSSSGRGNSNWSSQVVWTAQDNSSYTTTPTSHVLTGTASRSRNSSYTETSNSSGSYATPVVVIMGVASGVTGTYQEQRSSSGSSSSQESTNYANPHTGEYAASGTFQSTSSGSTAWSSSTQDTYAGIAASGTSTFVQQNSSQHAYSETGTLTADATGETRTASYTSQGQGVATATATDAGSYGRQAPGGIIGGSYSAAQNTTSRTQHSETGTYVAGPSGVYRSATFQNSAASHSQETSQDNPTYGSFRVWPTQGSMTTSGSGSYQTRTYTARSTQQSGTGEWMGNMPIYQSVSFQTSENTSTSTSGQSAMGMVHLNLPFNTSISGSQSNYDIQAMTTLSEQGTFVQHATAAPTRTGSFTKTTWTQGTQSGQHYYIFIDQHNTTIEGTSSSGSRQYAYSENTSYTNDLHTGTYQEYERTLASSTTTQNVHPHAPLFMSRPTYATSKQVRREASGTSTAGGTFTRERGVVVSSDQHYSSQQHTTLSLQFTANAGISSVAPAWGAPTDDKKPGFKQRLAAGVASLINFVHDFFTSDIWENDEAEDMEQTMDGTAGKPAPYQGTPYEPAGNDQTLSFTHSIQVQSNSESNSIVYGRHAQSPSGSNFWQVYSFHEIQNESTADTESMTAHYDAPDRKGLLSEVITDSSSSDSTYNSTGSFSGGTAIGTSMSAWSTSQETYDQTIKTKSNITVATSLSTWLDTGQDQHTHVRVETVTEQNLFDGTYQGYVAESMEVHSSGTTNSSYSSSETSTEEETGGKTETIQYRAGFGQLAAPK